VRLSRPHKPLNRTAFSTSRAAEYFDARQLSTLTGVPTDEFANVIIKELVDNSLDACETAGASPEISVAVGDGGTDGAIRIRVSDNGPGIPSEVVRRMLDYNVRVSDKAAYRSPTRGAQGNALKTVIGIPYALGSREPLTVVARGGIRHIIRPSVDPAGNVRVGNEESNGSPWTGGTSVDVPVVPGYVTDAASEHVVQDFHPQHWVRSFAAFNPHATFSYQDKSGDSEEAEIYKSTRKDIKKYVPSQPTSPHWYSSESLNVLVSSHIAHARNGGGRDLPLGTFVRQFAGLTSTKKAKAVCSALPQDLTHLSDFEDRPADVAWLLAVMKEEAKEPKAASLGHVGEEHFLSFFEHIYNVKECVYRKRPGTMPSGLPFTFEFALAVLDEPGHLYCGINFSPTFGDPLEGTTLAGPEFRSHGIQGFLSQAYALPTTNDAWFRTPASVAVAAHIVTPAPLFLDRGKTRLNMEGA
jgi:DNA topoisomerase VI subunit B